MNTGKTFFQLTSHVFLCAAVLVFLGSCFSVCSGKSKYSEILDRKIFADTPPPPQRPATSILKPLPLPSLDSLITLKGIIYSPDGGSKAIIQISARKTDFLCEEGDIIENARIIKINESGLVFLYDDKEISLTLQKPQSGTPAISVKDTSVKIVPSSSTTSTVLSPVSSTSSGSSVSIPSPQQPRDIKLNDIVEKFRSDPKLISSIGITPYIQEGKVEGFTVNRIPDSSIIAETGIQEGDTIRRVNGVLIDSIGKAYAVYHGILKSQSKIATLEILRNGQPIMLTYRLE